MKPYSRDKVAKIYDTMQDKGITEKNNVASKYYIDGSYMTIHKNTSTGTSKMKYDLETLDLVSLEEE